MHLLSRRATVGVVVALSLLLAISQVRSWSLGDQGRRSYLDDSALSGRSSISLSFTGCGGALVLLLGACVRDLASREYRE
jgi:hypothetical protein